MHIAIIWQRFLPYHIARIKHLKKKTKYLGFMLTPIEVATQDESYGFDEKYVTNDLEKICCFPQSSYHKKSSEEIYNKILTLLNNLKPDVVFAPATPFPEGMAAYKYRLFSKDKRAVMMDTSWEYTDRRGFLKKEIKRLIHQNIDAVFIPAPSHTSYYFRLGFPKDRIVLGVEVIDNDYFSEKAKQVRLRREKIREAKRLPLNYFLYVGRILPRKGLETLISAYKNYRIKVSGESWNLVIVGTGHHINLVKEMAKGIPGIIFEGAHFGDELCDYYGLANTLIVPSLIDQWGLVVNEGMASGLPVMVSNGCGAAKNLVKEGENGWTFDPGDVEKLTKLMLHISKLPQNKIEEMGKKSEAIVAEWSLDSYVEGVLKAIEIPRRPPAGILPNILTKLWKGRVRIT